jgi:hypothetical protein
MICVYQSLAAAVFPANQGRCRVNGARDATPALVIMNQEKVGVQSYVLSAITPPMPSTSNAPQLRNGAQILSAAIWRPLRSHETLRFPWC